MNIEQLPSMTAEQHRDNVKRCFTLYIEACRRSYHLTLTGKVLLADGVMVKPEVVGTWVDLVTENQVDVKESEADLDHAILWHQAAGLGDVRVTSHGVRFPGMATA